MIVFPDSNVETEYTDPNGSVWEFNGTGWVRQCVGSGGSGGCVDLEIPISMRFGVIGLPLNPDAKSITAFLRSGDLSLPLNNQGNRLTVNMRTGGLDLPLKVA